MDGSVMALAAPRWMRIERAVEYTGLPRALVDKMVDEGKARWYKTGEGRGCCKFVRVEDILDVMDEGAIRGRERRYPMQGGRRKRKEQVKGER